MHRLILEPTVTPEPSLPQSPEELTVHQTLIADIFIWSCVTWLAPFAFLPLMLGFGAFDGIVKGRASPNMKKFALGEAVFILLVIVVAATIGITLSVIDQKRTSGAGY